jgi:hypothetical protein
MITWFSAAAFRAGALLGFALAAVPARADEPPSAPVAPLSAKAREKRRAAEAHLAAARAAAGAGKAADARALYGQALAAALAAYGQEAAEGDAPRPTSVTSLANEQPREDLEAPTEAPVETAGGVGLAPAPQAAPNEEPATEAPRRPAPPLRGSVAVARAPLLHVAPAASGDAAAPVFQVGLRGALSATDPAGGRHVSGGLVFTWLTFAIARGRGAAVVDLESTRWRAGRADTTDRAQVAFYGLGFDWTFPFASGGTGLFLGAEAAAGVLQGSTMTTPAVQTSGVLQLMPHVGGAVARRGFGLFADAGWRVQLLSGAALGKASEGGLVVQGGLRVEMPTGAAPEANALDLGYTARLYAPNGSSVYGRYGGLPRALGAGPLLEHELRLTTNAYLPRHADHGVALTYLGADQLGGGAGLHVVGLGYLGTWHAFATRQLFNPYAGVRLGLAYISNGDASTFDHTKQVGGVASAMAGVDVGVHRRAALRLGVAYETVIYSNDVANASLSGYAVEAGVIVRL